MKSVLAWAVAHWPTVILPALVVAASILNDRLRYDAMRHGPLVKRALGLLIDWFAARTRKDSPGSWALPLLQLSKPPAGPAAPPTLRGERGCTTLEALFALVTAVALAVALGALAGGCTPAHAQTAGRAFGAIDKVMTWVCRAWPTVRAGAGAILPGDAGPPPMLPIPGVDRAPDPSSGGELRPVAAYPDAGP